VAVHPCDTPSLACRSVSPRQSRFDPLNHPRRPHQNPHTRGLVGQVRRPARCHRFLQPAAPPTSPAAACSFVAPVRQPSTADLKRNPTPKALPRPYESQGCGALGAVGNGRSCIR
jgi:hypothetical protein